MKLSLHRDCLRSFAISFVSRFLAVLILSSFAVTQLPIVNSLAEESSMPCCAGESSEHCDSGLAKPKPRPLITEPMCGWTRHLSLLLKQPLHLLMLNRIPHS